MKRVIVMARIVFYFVLGAVLLLCPWGFFWNSNFFPVHYAWVAAIAHNDFIRGAISGVGLADVWMAIEEIHKLGQADPVPTHQLR